MRKTVIVLFVLLLALPLVAGQESVDGLDQEALDGAMALYNENVDRVPGTVSSLVSDQRVNAYIELGNGTHTVFADLDGMKLQELRLEEGEDPTLEVWLDEGDIQRLLTAEEPMKEFDTMLEEGEVEYEAHGLVNQLRFAVAESALDAGIALGVV